MTPEQRAELERREMVAKCAMAIVRKFPQIEQDVLAPLLAVEIGKAILADLEAAEQREKALREYTDALEEVLDYRLGTQYALSLQDDARSKVNAALAKEPA